MSTQVTRIRAATPDDVPVMCEIHNRCWLEKFAGLVTPSDAVDHLDPHRNEPRFTEWCSPESDADVTVAERDGRVVAYATVEGNELLHLMVDPACAGRGIGRRLLADAEDRMSAAGHTSFELHTMVGNVPAIGLYESAGWQVTDRLIHSEDHHGVSYDEHVMVKHLP